MTRLDWRSGRTAEALGGSRLIGTVARDEVEAVRALEFQKWKSRERFEGKRRAAVEARLALKCFKVDPQDEAAWYTAHGLRPAAGLLSWLAAHG